MKRIGVSPREFELYHGRFTYIEVLAAFQCRADHGEQMRRASRRIFGLDGEVGLDGAGDFSSAVLFVIFLPCFWLTLRGNRCECRVPGGRIAANLGNFPDWSNGSWSNGNKVAPDAVALASGDRE